MEDDTKARKEMLRAEAMRTRSLLSISGEELDNFEKLFFQHIPIVGKTVVAAYWPKDREFDIRPLLDTLLERGYHVALPVVMDDSKILKFVLWQNETPLVIGKFGVCHPALDEKTVFLDPDVFLVPMLAFDRRGGRLGYGGGYYDATLEHYKKKQQSLAVGIAYAEQACLFHLPTEEHDIKMDWVITPQQAYSF